MPASPDDPEDPHVSYLARKEVLRHAKQLPPLERECAELLFDGLSIRDIAERLGLQTEVARQRCLRARDAIAERMQITCRA